MTDCEACEAMRRDREALIRYAAAIWVGRGFVDAVESAWRALPDHLAVEIEAEEAPKRREVSTPTSAPAPSHHTESHDHD